MCDDEALAKIAELEAEVQRLQASLAYADSLVEQAVAEPQRPIIGKGKTHD